MTYEVKITATALKERKRIDPSSRKRIDNALKKLIENPRPPKSRKLAGRQLDWRVRVGDYRILYEIDDDKALVTVWRIAHRREAYR
ncbi:MAG: type II toxin-antitoxin system RelE/ParE family toxin [Anaerolineae bacterium]